MKTLKHFLTHRRWLANAAALALCMVPHSVRADAGSATGEPPAGAAGLIERHLAAAGGRAVLDQVTSFVMTGTGKEREAEIQFTITAAPPGRCLLAGEAGGFRVRSGCDTDGVFWRQDPMGIRQLDSADGARDVTELLFSLNPFALAHWRELGFTLEADGTQDLEGCPVATVRAVRGQGPAVPLYFDAQSGLLVGVGESRLADYRDVGGWKLAHRLSAGKGLEIRITEAKWNVPLSPTAFAKPLEAADGPRLAFETRLSTNALPAVVRRPPMAMFSFPSFRELPRYNADSMNPFQVDLRGRDISGLDLNGRLSDLLHGDFDDGTKWPAVVPSGFEPQKIMELGLNPGLGVRQLHRRGITGKGIGIGIIDQPLLVGHVEYRDRLRLYEEIHVFMGEPNAAMHAAAVASIALGKTVGVAPEADLYFIAETHGEVKNGQFDWDFKSLAQAIERLLDVNRQLPSAGRIRVISISVGWSRGQKGFAEANAAVERATREGVFVISTALEQTHKLAFHGLGREPLKDPDDFASYGLGSWWARSFLDGQRRFPPGTRLLVPMDARSTASPTGENDYVHYAGGGWSWSVPYLAGLYALGCQVREDLTPQAFWETALKTGRTVSVTNRDETLELGTIADPAALIDALKKP